MKFSAGGALKPVNGKQVLAGSASYVFLFTGYVACATGNGIGTGTTSAHLQVYGDAWLQVKQAESALWYAPTIPVCANYTRLTAGSSGATVQYAGWQS